MFANRPAPAPQSPVALNQAPMMARLERRTLQGDCGQEESDVLMFPTPPREACIVPSFSFKQVKHNNLGGLGPDTGAPTLVFGEALPGIDLVVSNITAYNAKDPSKNGFGGNGAFAQVNLFQDRAVGLRLNLVDAATGRPRVVNHVWLTMLDLDQGLSCKARSGVVTAGYSAYYLAPGSNLKVTSNDGHTTGFQASRRGTGTDNPENAQTLAPEQMDRAVAFLFSNTSQISLSLSLTQGFGGRNFMFAGASALTEANCINALDVAFIH
jgi:hypothetical protein